MTRLPLPHIIRRIYPLTLTISSVFLLNACVGLGAIKDKDLVTLEDGASTQTPPVAMAGIMTWIGRQADFQPCGSPARYWLDMSDKTRTQLTDIRKNSPALAGKVTVNLMAHSTNPTSSETGARAQLLSVERAVQFQDIEQLGYMSIACDTVNNTLLPTDEEARENWQDVATLNVSPWIASYQTSADEAQENGLVTHLTLTSDYQAITRYDYTNGDAEITEEGFWQPINARQVLVTITSHDDKPVHLQRIYVHGIKDDTISTIKTNKEKINGNVYAIGGQGLVLHRDDTAEK